MLGSWESLFLGNGIRFRKSDKYSLLHHEGSIEESDSEADDRGSIKRRKKKKSRKKRRRDFDHNDNYDNGFLDFDTSNSSLGLQSGGGSWLLSFDDFSTSWTNVSSLPLSSICSVKLFITVESGCNCAFQIIHVILLSCGEKGS